MDNQVEEIKQKLDIVTVISKYLPLNKRGRHHLSCCPFHQEKTPSFTVSTELQIFKCFGCDKAGDIFNFVQEYERVDFREALQILAKQAGVTLVQNTHLSQEEAQHKTLISINSQLAEFYNYVLLNHPLGKTALDYVLNRGIKPEIIKKFKIGFAPTNSQLQVNFLLKKKYNLPDLIATGTFGQSHYGGNQLYDRFQGRLVFPLTDYRDRILGFAGRVLPGKASSNSAKYINSPETAIYHKSQMLFGLNLAKEAIRKSNSVIVVEGEFDMISPYQTGVENIVALKGTAFTPDQLQLLHRYTDTIILGLDSDFAGNNAARKSIEMADSLDFDIQVLILGEKYKDPDEAVKADPEFFKAQLQKTIPVWDFIIQTAVKNFDINTVKGKKQALEMVLPFLVKIKNTVIKTDYFRKLAFEIGSDEMSVAQEAARLGSPSYSAAHVKIQPQVDEVINLVKNPKLEEALINLILGARKPLLLAKKMENIINGLATTKLQPIISLLLTSADFEPLTFQEQLPAEIHPYFQTLFLNATSEPMDPHRRMLEVKKIGIQIETINLKERLNLLSQQIALMEKNEQNEELNKVELEYNQILLKLSQIQTKKS